MVTYLRSFSSHFLLGKNLNGSEFTGYPAFSQFQTLETRRSGVLRQPAQMRSQGADSEGVLFPNPYVPCEINPTAYIWQSPPISQDFTQPRTLPPHGSLQKLGTRLQFGLKKGHGSQILETVFDKFRNQGVYILFEIFNRLILLFYLNRFPAKRRNYG